MIKERYISKMILHLFPAEKFTTDYINRIQYLFDSTDHLFIIYGKIKREYRLDEITHKEQVIQSQTLYELGRVFEDLVKLSQKVICHSLFLKLVDLILLNKVISKNNASLVWNIWGKDLYEDYDRSKTVKAFLLVKPIVKEAVRKSLIHKMDIFITTGDYEVLQERYKLKPTSQVMGAQYTYNLLEQIEIYKNEKINVMVGHSATDTCRHIETFQMLKPYSGKIKVICPLSYPDDKRYIDMVTKIGREIFGDDFIPLTSFMKYEEYVKFLNTVDIGVFNNSRQQGMGNITNLLYLGKKVYLSQDNTIRKSYHKPEYNIFDCEEIQSDDFLILLTEDELKNNRNKIIYKFSDENFKKEWGRVFDA